MRAVGAAALLAPLVHGDAGPTLREEGPDTPKICLEMGVGRLAAGALWLAPRPDHGHWAGRQRE